MRISAGEAKKLLSRKGRVLPGPRGNCRKAGKGMNKLEQKFAAELELWLAAGDIVEYHFEHLKLRLGHDVFYTPDFLVVTPNEFQIYEVKGFWEDDARVKIKWAARLYWFFRIFSVEKGKRGEVEWKIKEIK